MKLNEKIIIAAGGSGGHLFPALALADRLEEKGKQIILLISSKKIDKKITGLRNYPIEITCSRPRFWCGVYPSFLKASKILVSYKPAVVVGFGGYNTIPILLLSAFKRIPTLIHEQNVLPGKANRVLAKFVDKIAVSFSSTKRFFSPRKVVFTGNPLRREIFAEGLSEEFTSLVKEKFTPLEITSNTSVVNEPVANKDKLLFKNFSVNRRSPKGDLSHTTSLRDKSLTGFTILITGGSQGAHRINIIALKTLNELSRSERDSLRLIHLCGETDYPLLKKEYSQLDINYSLFPFLERIGTAYAVADLIISRAGATSIAEIIAFKKAALLIPYPYANSHQKANAELLFSKDACLMVEEESFSPQYLKQTILTLKNNREKILSMEKNLEQFAVANADELLAEEVIKLTR